jgi:succinate dehydrogenase cytochrome b556 subunit
MAQQSRPLSPHLTVYAPQWTSTLSICHRISGLFLGGIGLAAFLGFQIVSVSCSFYPIYWCFCQSSLYILLAEKAASIALAYHLANGIRHLLWDSGFFLDLPQVIRGSFVMLVCAIVILSRNL